MRKIKKKGHVKASLEPVKALVKADIKVKAPSQI